MRRNNYLTNLGFIYGYEPSGHSVVAKAISQFIPKDVVNSYFLSLSDIFPNTARIVVKGYLEIIQKTPTLWSYIYDNPFIFFLHKNLGLKPPKAYVYKLEKYITKNSIDFIVSTHAFSSIIADKNIMKHQIKKHIGIITDIYANSFWPQYLDRYFVPHYETYKSLLLNGIDPSKIDIVGMPLRKEFYLPYNIAQLKRRLKLQDRFTFLITGGTKGLGDIFAIIEALKMINRRFNVVVLCGSNRSLLRKLKEMRYIGQLRILPFGYLANTAVFYAASDCVVGKPGGVTIFEVAAFGRPLIVWNALPGQEEKNRDFLKKHSYAMSPKDERELKTALEAIVNNKELYQRYSKSILSLHKREAPFKISRYIMDNL